MTDVGQVTIVQQSACFLSRDLKLKAVTANVVWTLDGISALFANSSPQYFDSPQLEVKCGNMLTRWHMNLWRTTNESFGFWLLADGDGSDFVAHEAHTKFSLGDGACTDSNYGSAPSKCPDDQGDKRWSYATFVDEGALMSTIKNDQLVIKLKLTVYHSHPEDFQKQTDNLETLFEKQVGDFVVHCEGQDIKVVKQLLTKTSPVLEAMFSTGLKEAKEGRMTIEDLDYDTVKDMLEFIYTGNFTGEMNAVKLLEAADKYQIESLKNFCVEDLIAELSMDNVCQMLALADKHCASKLKDAATKLICSAPEEAMATEGWKTYLDDSMPMVKQLLAACAVKGKDSGARKRKHEDN